MKNQLIYVLKCPLTDAVRYVGKTYSLKKRLRAHLYEARARSVKSHKCNWIRGLLQQGLLPIIQVDVVVPADIDWKRVECERVAFYKSMGCDLTNSTGGGDVPGELTAEGRRVLSERASQLFGTPEARESQRQMMKRLCADPEWREKRAAAAKAARSTPEYRARMSARSKAVWARPGQRDKARAARAEVLSRPEFREKHSAAVSKSQRARKDEIAERTRRAWAQPEIRERQLSAMRAACKRPGHRERCSTAQRRVYENPAKRAALAARSKDYWENLTPEQRASRGAALRVARMEFETKITPEQLARRSAATSEWIKTNGNPFLGKRHTDESRAKMSAYQASRREKSALRSKDAT